MHEITAKALNGITETIVGCAIRVHKMFGSGLLESAYSACLCHDLAPEITMKAGIHRVVNNFPDE